MPFWHLGVGAVGLRVTGIWGGGGGGCGVVEAPVQKMVAQHPLVKQGGRKE